ncbi:hypothetical protein H2200_003588 [Cladophialophora chaetospira]|uniref:Chitin synthase activator n=1 Tax=Cladophialophora chaetospira TaxID=386627 RepID=A0AA38XEH0_9EURO|nr:hypothetical protein H2200_003588 [Cladophialophora chaetospira]
MAGNQYGQQWPQNGAQQYPYDKRNDQRQWQENGRGQGPYNQDYQRYNEQPQSRNDYGPGPASAPPTSYGNAPFHGQGQDQYAQQAGYGEQHYEQPNSSSRPPRREHYDQGPPPQNRQYQYDERYRSNGQSRPPAPEHSHSDPRRPPRDQWSQPSTPQKRSKPRQRILTEPSSPKNLAWDNPFPTFGGPPKNKPVEKEHRHERHASLDHAMATVNLGERRNSSGSVPRPQTSSNNRRAASRPGTSHDRRPEMDRPPPPPQGYPTPVGRDSPDMARHGPPPQGFAAPVGRGSPEMNYRQSPAPRAQGGLDSPRMRPSGPNASRGPPPAGPLPHAGMNPDRPRPGPAPEAPAYDGRDAYNSQPTQANYPPGPQPHAGMVPDRPRPGPAPEAPAYDGRDAYNSKPTQANYPPPNRPRNNQAFDEGYGSDYIPQSRAHVSPLDRVQGRDQYFPAAQQDYRSNAPRGHTAVNPKMQNQREAVNPKMQSQREAVNPKMRNQRESNGMPDFDAIPTQMNEKSEDNLIANQQPSFDQNVYRKPTYQSSGGLPGQIDTNPIQQSPPNQTTSPLADFSFDLPGATQFRDENPAQRGPYRGGYNDNLNSRVAPNGYGDGLPQEMPASQPPPRTASRNGIKPSFENDSSRPPVPNNGQPYRSFSQDQYPVRPHTSNGQRPPQQSYEMMNPYEQDITTRAPSAPAAPVPFDQGYGPPSENQYQQLYGQGPPPRKASQDNYNRSQHFQQPYGQGPPMRQVSQDMPNQGFPRPSTANSANSAHPVPIRHYGPTPNAQTNPDALPAHPAPTRGGLTNSNAYQPGHPAPAQTPQKRDLSIPAPPPAPVTLEELNTLRQAYASKPNDHALGLKFAKKIVEAVKVLADMNGTADAKTTQKNRERLTFDAHKVLKKLVAANYPEAMFYLADCHGSGMLGLAVDPKEAFTLYQSAAKLNHPQSAYRVAVCCELGSEEGGGTRRDPLKAMQWYKRAATLGDTPAMYKMGMILLKGLLSQQKNPREAVSWLKRAAERADKDNPHALHELGLLYESPTPPDNILRDERYAVQLFQQSAELGYKYSQFRLGSAYEYGLLGCPIDARQSIAWYTRAAAQGEHQSELALSGWYLTGSEPLLTQSDTEAFLWARKAASSGLAKAEYAMGYFNEVGIGTAVDVEEAKRWYYRAASQNFGKARERLEELKRGGPKQQKTRMSRSNVNKQSEGECVVM